MNKDIYNQVMERANGHCEVCGSSNTKLCLHHGVYGRGKRNKHETVESCFALCWECHQGSNGVHNNKQLDIKLKLIIQNRYRQLGKSENEIRELMGGRLYFGGDAA